MTNTEQAPTMANAEQVPAMTSMTEQVHTMTNAEQVPAMTNYVSDARDSLREGASRPKYRIGLYHLCNCIPGLALAISKYILNSRGEPFNLNKFDFSLGVFQFILYLIGRYESCPPSKLRWFLNTDWGFILNLIRKAASHINSRYKGIQDPFGFWIFLLMVIGSVHCVLGFAWTMPFSYDPLIRKKILEATFTSLSMLA
ncbi:hypothetical protein APHAL10511_005350 [Amanita phalloides]|nr:hypothetical protein APHAL10511_005350 [Amanita phalloides]